MVRRQEMQAALAVAAVGLGTDFATGRAPAAFYAQMGRASWLGILVSAVLFGGFTGLFASIARRTGAGSMPELLQRFPGGSMGRMVKLLYFAIVCGAACMAIFSAGHIGALTLPVQHGALMAGGMCALLSIVLALCGERVVQALGAIFILCAGVFALGLFFFARSADVVQMNLPVDLRLENSWIASVFFALLHASANVCISAGPAVRFSQGCLHPVRMGWFAGWVYFLLLGLGNGVLRLHAQAVLVLKLPFVALSSGWGIAGFYISAAMNFLSALTILSSILCALLPKQKCQDFIEK